MSLCNPNCLTYLAKVSNLLPIIIDSIKSAGTISHYTIYLLTSYTGPLVLQPILPTMHTCGDPGSNQALT